MLVAWPLSLVCIHSPVAGLLLSPSPALVFLCSSLAPISLLAPQFSNLFFAPPEWAYKVVSSAATAGTFQYVWYTDYTADTAMYAIITVHGHFTAQPDKSAVGFGVSALHQ